MVDKNKHINENELDDLLKQAFLENDQNITDDQAKFVFDQEYDVKIDPVKEKDLMKKFTGGSGNSILYIVITILVVVVTGTIFFLIDDNEKEDQMNTEPVELEEVVEAHDMEVEKFDFDLEYEQINDEEIRNMEEVASVMENELRTILGHVDTFANEVPIELKGNEISEEKDTLILNEKLVRRFKKIKWMMLEKLINDDKKLYVSIFPGRVNYKGNDLDLSEFYIRNCPVTNLEYKTFLIDLLINGRTDDYKKARVKSDIWNNYQMAVLAVSYFKSEKYNDFPVVNISQEGAELFCKWLEDEANIYARKIKKKVKGFEIRFPYDTEWIHMAATGHANMPDYDGYHTIFDINEGYIDKSIEKRVKGLKKGFKKKKPENEFYSTNRYEMNEKQVVEILMKAFELHDPLPFDTIWPKRMKDFGKFGHVSEMIKNKDSGEVIIYGTCWKNKEQFVDMMTRYTKSSGSPFVGLRIVKVYDDAPVYKNPFY